MRLACFSISVFLGTIFAMTYGARPTAAKLGRRAGRDMAATRNGSPSIRLAALVMGSSTSSGPSSLLVNSADSAGPPTAGPLGRLRSVFQILPIPERWTWTRTAIFLLAEEGARFTAFARQMHRTQTSHHQLSIKTLPLTSVATSFRAG